jgi:hypothetical protein
LVDEDGGAMAHNPDQKSLVLTGCRTRDLRGGPAGPLTAGLYGIRGGGGEVVTAVGYGECMAIEALDEKRTERSRCAMRQAPCHRQRARGVHGHWSTRTEAGGEIKVRGAAGPVIAGLYGIRADGGKASLASDRVSGC